MGFYNDTVLTICPLTINIMLGTATITVDIDLNIA